MNPLRLRLRERPPHRIDMGGLLRCGAEGIDAAEIARRPLWLGNRQIPAGELFEIRAGDPGRVVIANACDRLDRIGAGMASGEILVEGDCGAYLGEGMTGGRIRVSGDVDAYAGTGMAGGHIQVCGHAGDFAGGAIPGERRGMRGGTLLIGGDCGDRAGDRMRRGLLLVSGRAGAYCGSRMLAGTLACLGATGPGTGHGMRRGTVLLHHEPQGLPPTFNDSGTLSLGFLVLLLRELVALDPAFGALEPARRPVHRYVGDLACQGLGEILVM